MDNKILNEDVVQMIKQEYVKIYFLKKSYYVMMGVIGGFVISTLLHMNLLNRMLDLIIQ